MKKKITAILFLVLSSGTVSAEEIPTTALSNAEQTILSLDVIDQNFNSTDRIVIDQESIKRSRASSLAQVLSSQANVVITSSNFQPNSVFVRGGDSSHVLFVVDDVPTYDASTLQKTVNLSGMNVANIKRIEILKGSQSVLYGGQALSAVIKIYTIPQEFKNSGKAMVQYGTQYVKITDPVTGEAGSLKKSDSQTTDSAVGFDHRVSEKLLVSVSGKYKEAKNPSPVLDSMEIYSQKTATADLSMTYQLSPDIKSILKFSFLEDANFVPTTLQPDVKAVDTKDFKFGTRNFSTTAIVKKSDQFNLSFSAQKSGRQLFQEAINSPISTKTDFDYTGELTNSRFEYFFPKHSLFSALLGTSIYTERFEELDLTNGSKAQGATQYQGAFTKLSVNAIPEALLVEGGYRREDGLDTYQAGLTLWKDLKLEYSTGFKAPSLSQLYSANYGNPNLKPEKSETVNLSYQKKLNEEVLTSFSVFDSNYRNLFVFIGTKYENVATSRTKGAEFAANFASQKYDLNYQIFLAYQEPYDSSTRTWLVKRPLRSAGAKMTHFLSGDKASVTLEINHVGERRDKQTSSRYVTINSYTVVNLAGNYKLGQNTEFFARIDNLNNQTYQQGYGYWENGIKSYLGFQVGY